MQRTLKRSPLKPMQDLCDKLEVVFDKNVFFYILEELKKYPNAEEGGKYIGYVFEPNDPNLEKLHVNHNARAIVVTDFLPSGPKAKRNAVEFLPDGPFQEALFRQAEQSDPKVEHVGSWHSHHCNGLRTLSDGDIKGYLRTVNKTNYRLDFFIASLVKHMPDDPRKEDWIDHFIFVRGNRNYYHLTNQVRIADWPTIFSAQTGHHREVAGLALVDSTGSNRKPGEGASIFWYETGKGRQILSEDKRYFHEQFGSNVAATRKDHKITMTGHKGSYAIQLTYPRDEEMEEISVLVKLENVVLLKMDSFLSSRKLAIVAALSAIQYHVTNGEE